MTYKPSDGRGLAEILFSHKSASSAYYTRCWLAWRKGVLTTGKNLDLHIESAGTDCEDLLSSDYFVTQTQIDQF